MMKIIIAVNQINLDESKTVVSTIYFNFLDENDLFNAPDQYFIALSFNIDLGMEIEAVKQEYYSDTANALIDLSALIEYEVLEFIINSVQTTMNIDIELSLSGFMTEYGANSIQTTMNIPIELSLSVLKTEYEVNQAQTTIDIPISLDITGLMTEYEVNQVQTTMNINSLGISITAQKGYLITYHEDGADVNNNPRTFIFSSKRLFDYLSWRWGRC